MPEETESKLRKLHKIIPSISESFEKSNVVQMLNLAAQSVEKIIKSKNEGSGPKITHGYKVERDQYEAFRTHVEKIDLDDKEKADLIEAEKQFFDSPVGKKFQEAVEAALNADYKSTITLVENYVQRENSLNDAGKIDNSADRYQSIMGKGRMGDILLYDPAKTDQSIINAFIDLEDQLSQYLKEKHPENSKLQEIVYETRERYQNSIQIGSKPEILERTDEQHREKVEEIRHAVQSTGRYLINAYEALDKEYAKQEAEYFKTPEGAKLKERFDILLEGNPEKIKAVLSEMKAQKQADDVLGKKGQDPKKGNEEKPDGDKDKKDTPDTQDNRSVSRRHAGKIAMAGGAAMIGGLIAANSSKKGRESDDAPQNGGTNWGAWIASAAGLGVAAWGIYNMVKNGKSPGQGRG
jgi:hypothetical protein